MFHWIQEEIGYTKIFSLLKSGGTLALFWNYLFVNRENDILHSEIQQIYNQYRPSDRSPVEFNINNCKKIIDILNHYGFTNIVSKLFYQTRTFNSQDYISLLSTYSDHRAMQESLKNSLEQEIASAIYKFGRKLKIYDTMDLYLAQKP